MLRRRDVCAGIALSLAAGDVAVAADKVFATGPLADNRLARTFDAPPRPLTWPDTPLVGERGPERLSALRGRTYLVSLWAEWCAPCLAEAGDLAALGEAYGGASFELVFVLTGSKKALDFAGARAVLARYGAGRARLLVEPDGRDAVMHALATRETSAAERAAILSHLPEAVRANMKLDAYPSLPCNLLVDRRGRIRARSFGSSSAAPAQGSHEGVMTEADKARVLTERTAWSTPAGRALVAALAAGALDRS